MAPGVLNLARLLVAKRRIRLVEQIRAEFSDLLDEHEGRARALVTTAVPLSDEQKDEVAAKLERDHRQEGEPSSRRWTRTSSAGSSRASATR